MTYPSTSSPAIGELLASDTVVAHSWSASLVRPIAVMRPLIVDGAGIDDRGRDIALLHQPEFG